MYWFCLWYFFNLIVDLLKWVTLWCVLFFGMHYLSIDIKTHRWMLESGSILNVWKQWRYMINKNSECINEDCQHHATVSDRRMKRRRWRSHASFPCNTNARKKNTHAYIKVGSKTLENYDPIGAELERCVCQVRRETVVAMLVIAECDLIATSWEGSMASCRADNLIDRLRNCF